MLKNRFSLRSKILLVVSMVIFIVGLITALAVFYQTSNVLINNRESSIKAIIEEQTQESSLYFAQSAQFVKLIAKRNIIIDYLENPTEILKNDLVKNFDDYQKENPQYLAVYLLDKKGKAIISSDKTFLNQDYSYREYYKKAMLGQADLIAQLGVTSHQFGYYFSYPVKSNNGKNFIGVVVAKLNNKNVDEILKDSPSDIGSIMLVDEMGVVMYSQKENRFLKSLGKLSPKDKKILSEENLFGDISIEPITYDPVQVKVKENIKLTSLKFFDKQDNEDEFIVVAEIAGTPYHLILEESFEDINTEAFQVTIFIGIGVLLAAILAMILIIFVVMKILSPLNKINDFTENVGKGDLRQRLNIETGDEFEKLSLLLNKMLDNLQDLYKNLEIKVKERTEKLEKLNKFMTGRELKMIELKNKIKELEKQEV